MLTDTETGTLKKKNILVLKGQCRYFDQGVQRDLPKKRVYS